MLDPQKLEIAPEGSIMHNGIHVVPTRMLRKERKAWIAGLDPQVCQGYFDRGLLVPDPDEVREGESLEVRHGHGGGAEAKAEAEPAAAPAPRDGGSEFSGWASKQAEEQASALGLTKADFRGRVGNGANGAYTKADVIDIAQAKGL